MLVQICLLLFVYWIAKSDWYVGYCHFPAFQRIKWWSNLNNLCFYVPILVFVSLYFMNENIVCRFDLIAEHIILTNHLTTSLNIYIVMCGPPVVNDFKISFYEKIAIQRLNTKSTFFYCYDVTTLNRQNKDSSWFRYLGHISIA